MRSYGHLTRTRSHTYIHTCTRSFKIFNSLNTSMSCGKRCSLSIYSALAADLVKHRGEAEYTHPGEHPRRRRTTDRAPRRRAWQIFALRRCRVTPRFSIRCRRVDRANVALRLPFLLLLLLRRVLHHCIIIGTINQHCIFSRFPT